LVSKSQNIPADSEAAMKTRQAKKKIADLMLDRKFLKEYKNI
jgi:hypothetical protein